MTCERPVAIDGKTPIEKTKVEATGEWPLDIPAWSKLSENSVPVRRKTGHPEAKERAARLRLILSRRGM